MAHIHRLPACMFCNTLPRSRMLRTSCTGRRQVYPPFHFCSFHVRDFPGGSTPALNSRSGAAAAADGRASLLPTRVRDGVINLAGEHLHPRNRFLELAFSVIFAAWLAKLPSLGLYHGTVSPGAVSVWFNSASYLLTRRVLLTHTATLDVPLALTHPHLRTLTAPYPARSHPHNINTAVMRHTFGVPFAFIRSPDYFACQPPRQTRVLCA